MHVLRAKTLAATLAVMLLTVPAWLASGFMATCDAAEPRQEQTMSDDRFWALIDRSAAYESDPGRQLESLASQLRALPAAEIEAFDLAYRRQLNRAYTWELWGAAYVAHGGLSDDGFEYFRSWLISKGRAVYERVLADPDVLADLLVADAEGVLQFEQFAYVAAEVWVQRTGRSVDDFAPMVSGWLPRAEPQGVPFEDDEAYLAAHYPKLWRRFGDDPLM